MASAHLIESTQAKPIKYRANAEAWSDLLGLVGELPIWRFWYQIYAFAAKVIISHESGEWNSLSPYLMSTKLRDLVEDHRDVFIWNHIDIPDLKIYIGEEYLSAFVETMNNLAMWIKKEA